MGAFFLAKPGFVEGGLGGSHYDRKFIDLFRLSQRELHAGASIRGVDIFYFAVYRPPGEQDDVLKFAR